MDETETKLIEFLDALPELSGGFPFSSGSRFILGNGIFVPSWYILLMYRGSIAHGMYVPATDPDSIDDKDIMGVCVPPIDYYFGLKQYGSRGTREIKHNEWDIVIYEAKKMISLLSKGNPNVLMALWLNDEHYLYKSPAGQLLIDNRDLFVGKHVYKSFVGYAHGQVSRMIKYSFKGYMGEKRKKLVKKFGYDTKNAAHLIRLLRMGIEFLNDGKLYVDRSDYDAEELLQIKHGEWSLNRVQSESERLFERTKKAYDQSKLPETSDIQEVNKLCVRIINKSFYNTEEN